MSGLLDLSAVDPGDPAEKRTLAAAFALSLELLEEELSRGGLDVALLVAGSRALGHGPRSGWTAVLVTELKLMR